MSYVHPAFAAHQRKRFMRPDAYRFAKPGTPEAKMPGYLHPWAEVARREQAAADEAKAREAAEQAEFERDVKALREANTRLRIMLADVKFALALRRIFQRKYSPDQPRVPAGNPDGGQWTDGGGGGVGVQSTDLADSSVPDGIVLSDASPDPIVPGAQYAENAASKRYSVILADEEAPKGIGHAIREHVGKTDAELLQVVQNDWIRYSSGKFEITDYRVAEGSFLSLESANDFVNRTLESHKETVDRVASGDLDRATLDKRFGYPTGKEAFRSNGDSEPYIRDTYAVRVVIRNDPSSERGYRVRTAFPINEYPK